MLDSGVAKSVIDHALFLGADFAELFAENRYSNTIELSSSEVSDISDDISSGVGVRLFYGHNVLYGFTYSKDEADLKKVIDVLTERSKGAQIIHSAAFNPVAYINQHPCQRPLRGSSYLSEKVSFLNDMDAAVRSYSPLINQFIGRVNQVDQHVMIYNSEGLQIEDTRHWCYMDIIAIAEKNGQQTNGIQMPGALSGWEFVDAINERKLAQDVAESAVRKLDAAVCPSGELPVVIGNGFGGVIFHEACGHLLETTSVEKQASVFHDQMGELIANSVVNAVDDGTIANQWGSLNIDDEGMPVQRTQLIKDGRLTGFMVDKMGSIKTGYERTGSGRRESYRYAPASRMRNTYIEAGDSSFEDMIGSIDYGIYAAQMGGGSVQPGTGEFNFAVNDAFLIENGKITKPLKSATLIGTGPKVLQDISMVGNDLSLAGGGWCGSISGAVPTSIGQPSLKVDRIVVGGGNE
ncbi:TldD/PmbA family protein [Vibrio palustris]|uniref:Protease TldD n=1 Tax=Vibrio palustris TaxID=1918946 RepID=A0A1R4B509_9VIBR|nr:TldD/PmbA family protein [Vibrio palustris]SJL83993.1 protease TldD [Vibrio palustris]